MKLAFIAVAMCVAFVATAVAQVTLNGILREDSGRIVANTKVGVAGGPADVTDSKGQFVIKLPRDFVQGERVIITVAREGWVVNHPLDGEWNLPNHQYQHVQTTKVIIVPKGSKSLWSHERIERFIAKVVDDAV